MMKNKKILIYILSFIFIISIFLPIITQAYLNSDYTFTGSTQAAGFYQFTQDPFSVQLGYKSKNQEYEINEKIPTAVITASLAQANKTFYSEGFAVGKYKENNFYKGGVIGLNYWKDERQRRNDPTYNPNVNFCVGAAPLYGQCNVLANVILRDYYGYNMTKKDSTYVDPDTGEIGYRFQWDDDNIFFNFAKKSSIHNPINDTGIGCIDVLQRDAKGAHKVKTFKTLYDYKVERGQEAVPRDKYEPYQSFDASKSANAETNFAAYLKELQDSGELHRGALVFWATPASTWLKPYPEGEIRKITHVAIYFGDGKFLQSTPSGKSLSGKDYSGSWKCSTSPQSGGSKSGFCQYYINLDEDINPSLYIIKQSTTPELLSKYPITGAEFTVYTSEEAANTANNNLIAGRPAGTTGIAKDTSGNNAILTVPNGSTNGHTNTINIKAGEYWVVETKAPNNYIRSTEIKKVVVSNSNTAASVTYINKIPKAYLIITKRGSNTALLEQFPISGAEFTVYTSEDAANTAIENLNNGRPAGTVGIAKDIYDNNAILTVPNGSTNGKTNKITLGIGTYYIIETKAPQGYALSSEIKNLNISENNDEETFESDFIFTNEIQKGKLFIKKIVEGTTILDPIGLTFTVYKDAECTQIAKMFDSNNNIVDAKLTIVRKEDNQDYWVSNPITLPVGTYYVREDELSYDSPFIMVSSDTDNQPINITSDTIKSKTFINKPKIAKVSIKKISTQPLLLDKFPIIGTTFTIYSEYVDDKHYTIAKDIYTGEDAVLIVEDNDGNTNTVFLLPGTYWIVETVTMPYYETIENQKETFKNGDNKILEFINILQVGKGKVHKTW